MEGVTFDIIECKGFLFSKCIYKNVSGVLGFLYWLMQTGFRLIVLGLVSSFTSDIVTWLWQLIVKTKLCTGVCRLFSHCQCIQSWTTGYLLNLVLHASYNFYFSAIGHVSFIELFSVYSQNTWSKANVSTEPARHWHRNAIFSNNVLQICSLIASLAQH